jgi:hypothetical protein
LQHFQFCRVGLSLGILYLSILGHQVVTCIKEQDKEKYTWYGFGHDVKLLVS